MPSVPYDVQDAFSDIKIEAKANPAGFIGRAIPLSIKGWGVEFVEDQLGNNPTIFYKLYFGTILMKSEHLAYLPKPKSKSLQRASIERQWIAHKSFETNK